jgi:uncharacterized protein (TIGR02246 family)
MDIETLVAAWTRAWNAHDMQAAATLVDVDVEFVTVAGRWLRGRPEFLRHHQAIHLRHMRETRWTTLAYETRPLRGDLSLVHLEWAITGERSTENRGAARLGTFTWVVERSPDRGLILVAHNTNLRADTPHRLCAR